MTHSINYTKPQLNLSPTNNYIINTYTKTSLVPSPPASSLTSFSTLLALDATEAMVEDWEDFLGSHVLDGGKA